MPTKQDKARERKKKRERERKRGRESQRGLGGVVEKKRANP
jgi:hypothetical protein